MVRFRCILSGNASARFGSLLRRLWERQAAANRSAVRRMKCGAYGEEVYEICKKYMELREKMRPYVRSLMEAAHEKGTPVMRPLFYDFPEDKKAWEVEDEYMFGPDVLVAPVLYEGIREREVYLPEGNWRKY